MRHRFTSVAAAAALAAAAFATPASAATQSTMFHNLVASATIGTPLAADDTLIVDTLVTGETGALSQSVTFTLAAGVSSLVGNAAWEITTLSGPGPRLVGVNIDIVDAGNTVVASDTFAGTLAGFAMSTFASSIGPGTYTLVATGTAVRDSVLDISLSFAAPVPEPETYALLLAGLGVIGFVARRSRHRG